METMTRLHRRRSRRCNIMWPCTVIASDDYRYQCTILDISDSGARVESEFSPLPTMTMKLQCQRFGTLSGEVVWTRGKMAGMRFHGSPAEVVRVLKSIVPGLGRREPAALQPTIGQESNSVYGTQPRIRSQQSWPQHVAGYLLRAITGQITAIPSPHRPRS